MKIGDKMWYVKHNAIQNGIIVDKVINGKCEVGPNLWYTDDRSSTYYIANACSGPIHEKKAFRTKLGLVLSLLVN
jgi:hypothetical protein